MFPITGIPLHLSRSLPHRRGDVSVAESAGAEVDESSPQAWGCFHFTTYGRHLLKVFPTGVGMFLG